MKFYDYLRSLISRALPSILEPDEWLEQRIHIDRILSLPPVDTIALYRQIAEAYIKKNGFPIKIVS